MAPWLSVRSAVLLLWNSAVEGYSGGEEEQLCWCHDGIVTSDENRSFDGRLHVSNFKMISDFFFFNFVDQREIVDAGF